VGWEIWCGGVYGKGVGMLLLLLDWDLTTMERNGSRLPFQIYLLFYFYFKINIKFNLILGKENLTSI
jgi:hypothetical protein